MTRLTREQNKIIGAIRDYPRQAKQIHLVAEHADFEEGEVNIALLDLANRPTKVEKKQAIKVLGGLAAILPATAAIGNLLAIDRLDSHIGYTVVAATTGLIAATACNFYEFLKYESRKYNYSDRLNDARVALIKKLRKTGQREIGDSEDLQILDKYSFYEEHHYP